MVEDGREGVVVDAADLGQFQMLQPFSMFNNRSDQFSSILSPDCLPPACTNCFKLFGLG